MIKKLIISLIVVTIFTHGFAIAGDITDHRIIVPEEFSWGRSQEAFSGTSPIERYVEAYEKTWWKVMNAFVAEKPKWRNHSHFICSGTPAEARACIDAFNAASGRLAALLNNMDEVELKKLIRPRLGR